jgi:hypothetical protein
MQADLVPRQADNVLQQYRFRMRITDQFGKALNNG